MKESSSKTAAQMALSRALESRRPPSERICFDAYAERFLGGAYKLLLFGAPLRNAVEQIIEHLFAGHHYYVLVRTRYLDEILEAQLTDGVEQLVILGAGYDSRAYRFANRLQNVAVFEVDHPATSNAKQAKVRGLGAAPPNLRYVPVDFNRDRLGDRLADSGYRDKRRTIFLWEGTTPYVSAAGIDETLRFVQSSGGAGSLLVFDYILESVLRDRCTLRGAQAEYAKMKRTSEPFVFGIAAEKIAAFLAARGFRLVEDVGAAELRTRFLPDQRRTRYIKPWWRIVHAALA